MTVKGDEMCVACTWQDGVFGVEVWERLVVDSERWSMEVGE
jgi:hypothetical protein